MNKSQYLKWLRAWDACTHSMEWVESRPETTARDILLACDRVDWLCWSVGRMAPTKIAEFARRCADRARTERTMWAERTAWASASNCS